MLARLKDADSVSMLQQLLIDRATAPNVLLSATAALGSIGDIKAFDVLADRFTHPWAPMRAATMAAAAKLDPEAFLLLVSGVGLDKDWSVRAALATTLAPLDKDRRTSTCAPPRLRSSDAESPPAARRCSTRLTSADRPTRTNRPVAR